MIYIRVGKLWVVKWSDYGLQFEIELMCVSLLLYTQVPVMYTAILMFSAKLIAFHGPN